MHKISFTRVLLLLLVSTVCSDAAYSAPAAPDFKPASKFGNMGGGTSILNLNTGGVQPVEFDNIELSPNGKWLVGNTWTDNQIYVRNIVDGRTQRMGKVSDLSLLRWEPNSKGFIAYYDAYLRSEPSRYKRKKFLLSQPGKAQDLSASPAPPDRKYSFDGAYYAAPLLNEDNSIVIKQASNGREIQRFKGEFHKSYWTFDSNQLFFRHSIGDKYHYGVWNSKNRGFRFLDLIAKDSGDFYYSPFGNWMLGSDESTKVYLSRPNGTQRIRVVNLHSELAIGHIAWLPDGYRILVLTAHGE